MSFPHRLIPVQSPPVAPAGYVFLTRADGTYLTNATGNYLIKAVSQ